METQQVVSNHEVEAAAWLETKLQNSEYPPSFPINIFDTTNLVRFPGVLVAMAEASGITESSIKAKVMELLQPTYVEVEDMSGTFTPPYPSITISFLTDKMIRWLRASFLSGDCIASIRKKDYVGKTSFGK